MDAKQDPRLDKALDSISVAPPEPAEAHPTTEVREAHMLAGEADFLLKIVAADWDSYQRFLSTKLTSAPNVAHVKSAMTLRVSKAEPGVPLGSDVGIEDTAA